MQQYVDLRDVRPVLHLHLPSVIPASVWDSPCHLSPDRGKRQGGKRDTREAAGEPGEIHATLGTGVNEKESGENESISTPSMGPLTLHQHPTYTGGTCPGFTNQTPTHTSTPSMCKGHRCLLKAGSVSLQYLHFDKCLLAWLLLLFFCSSCTQTTQSLITFLLPGSTWSRRKKRNISWRKCVCDCCEHWWFYRCYLGLW